MARWTSDVLGDDFQELALDLVDDDEGAVSATLVRHRPAVPKPEDEPTARHRPSPHDVWQAAREAIAARHGHHDSRAHQEAKPPSVQTVDAVLYIHGWSDYFFQRELAEFFTDRGYEFYAVDLRKYGRSLRDHHTQGYVDNLTVYDEDIDAARAAIATDYPGATIRLTLVGHSTGGLVAALYTDRHPETVTTLILNSPWLELQGSYIVRGAATPIVKEAAKHRPKHAIPNVDLGFNYRTVSANADGEWSYDEQWRPPMCFPVRYGWLNAIMDGHRQVAAGLDIDCPVLCMTSARSIIAPHWSDDMHHADVVIDVTTVDARAIHLAPIVTVARINGGLHDLVLSAPPVRADVYRVMDDFLRARHTLLR